MTIASPNHLTRCAADDIGGNQPPELGLLDVKPREAPNGICSSTWAMLGVPVVRLERSRRESVISPPLRVTPARRDTGRVSRPSHGGRSMSDGSGRRSRLPVRSEQGADRSGASAPLHAQAG